MKRKPRRGVLSVRFGFNPNSSSLGADLTGLILGGTGAMLLAVAVSVWIRLTARAGGGAPHGTASGDGTGPA